MHQKPQLSSRCAGSTECQLAAGTVPFRAETVMQLYDIIRTQPVAFPAQPETSQGAKDLILRLLHKDPDQRATMQEAMRHRWTEFGSTRPLRCQQVRLPGQAHSAGASWARLTACSPRRVRYTNVSRCLLKDGSCCLHPSVPRRLLAALDVLLPSCCALELRLTPLPQG